MNTHSWVGLDVGGANLKAAAPGRFAESLSFELWKKPEELAGALTALINKVPPEYGVAATMTGELADCYRDKQHGVFEICESLRKAAGARQLLIYTTQGNFLPVNQAAQSPRIVAAANWHAIALAVAARRPSEQGVLVDIGSTTTDVIPFSGGQVVSQGMTDVDRLRHGELLYFGLSRTPLCALVAALPYRGELCPVAAELFATTLDVSVLLGFSVGNSPTADGRPATLEYSVERMARMLCLDATDFSVQDARDAAQFVYESMTTRVGAAMQQGLNRLAGEQSTLVLSGSGVVLARAAASSLDAATQEVLLSEVIGQSSSECAAAEAVAYLAELQGCAC